METTKSEPVSPRLESLPFWTWIILLGICLLIFIIFSVALRDNDNEKNDNPGKENATSPSQQKNEYEWVIEKTITVHFTGEYSDIFRGVHRGDLISFENASEPYCVHNKVEEYCGQKGEDVGPQMPNSTNNGELRFKSQNGKTAYIDIVFWKIK